jgi:nucleotide-binding universal stress UspA family protein
MGVVSFDIPAEKIYEKLDSVEKETVIIAVEDSIDSQYILEWAVKNYFTLKVEGIKVILETVLQHYGDDAADERYSHAYKNLKRLHEFMVLKLGKGIEVESLISYGLPGKAIVQHASKIRATAILVGTRKMGRVGLGKEKKLVMGAASEYCARNAQCKVTVIKQY